MQSEVEKEKRMKKNDSNLRQIEATSKCTSGNTRSSRKKGGRIFKEVIANNFPSLMRKTNLYTQDA